jgi:hypothetical protein
MLLPFTTQVLLWKIAQLHEQRRLTEAYLGKNHSQVGELHTQISTASNELAALRSMQQRVAA